jgi:desulfoferrodoxin (superoxide reductase-like protein)
MQYGGQQMRLDESKESDFSRERHLQVNEQQTNNNSLTTTAVHCIAFMATSSLSYFESAWVTRRFQRDTLAAHKYYSPHATAAATLSATAAYSRAQLARMNVNSDLKIVYFRN